MDALYQQVRHLLRSAPGRLVVNGIVVVTGFSLLKLLVLAIVDWLIDRVAGLIPGGQSAGWAIRKVVERSLEMIDPILAFSAAVATFCLEVLKLFAGQTTALILLGTAGEVVADLALLAVHALFLIFLLYLLYRALFWPT